MDGLLAVSRRGGPRGALAVAQLGFFDFVRSRPSALRLDFPKMVDEVIDLVLIFDYEQKKENITTKEIAHPRSEKILKKLH